MTLIEKLKGNKIAFGLLGQEEQECFKSVGKDNCMLYRGDGEEGGWREATSSIWYRQNTYAIRPDYLSDPEFEKHYLSVLRGCIECEIACEYYTPAELIQEINFDGFFYEDSSSEFWCALDFIALNLREGHKVYARFRK